MGPDQSRLTPAERANLVAYMDGELDEEESRAIAFKLTQSKTARREVEVLEKTWKLLEHLDRPKASEDFTARTLTELEQLSTRSDTRAGAARDAARSAARLLTGVAICVLVSLAVYASVAWLWPHPTARLARDLPLAENLDAYLDVGSFEFLEKLDKSPGFAND